MTKFVKDHDVEFKRACYKACYWVDKLDILAHQSTKSSRSWKDNIK